jgi:hypothetical protein
MQALLEKPYVAPSNLTRAFLPPSLPPDPHYLDLLLEEGLLIEGVALSLALDLVHLTGSRLAVVLLRF